MRIVGEQTDIRSQNCDAILCQLRGRPSSRAEIARETGLSRSTVSAIVSYLLCLGLVVETGHLNRGGGRPGILLTLAKERFVLFGAELGRRRTEVVAMDLGGAVLKAVSLDGIDGRSPSDVLTQLAQAIANMHEILPHRTLLGVGIGAPSPIDPAEPGHLSGSILPNWSGINVQDTLEKAINAPVFVDNDANMGAFAEYWWSGNTESVIFVKLGTGVGAGLIASGKIHYGFRGGAGEIGHLSIDSSGPRCVCGQDGCLVKFVGSDAIRETANGLGLDIGHDGGLGLIKKALDEGDDEVVAFVEQLAARLATGLTSLINVIAPRRILISGALVDLGDGFVERLQAHLTEKTFFDVDAPRRVFATSHGRIAAAKGACGYVMCAIFNDVRRLELPARETA